MNEFADADGIKVGNAISSQSTTSWVDGGALVAFYAVLDCWTKQCAFAGPTTGRNILVFCAFVYFLPVLSVRLPLGATDVVRRLLRLVNPKRFALFY